MKYSLLNRTHPDTEPAAVRRYRDLFEGGEALRARIADYLPKNEQEPAPVYLRRCARAHYLNYSARIVRWFAAALFGCPPVYRSEPEAPEWYTARLKEDADGAGTDLDVVLRDAFTRALVAGRAYVRVERPEPGEVAPLSLADADRAGLRDVRVCPVPTEHVRHWRRNPDGSFAWVLEHQRREELVELADATPTITETWTLWREDGTAQRWELAYKADRKPTATTDIPEVEAPTTFGVIPLIELQLPCELHLMRHIADAQVELFRKRNALSWAVDRTCYAMPAFFLKDRKKPPVMGTGYYLILGETEKVEWPAPPSAPFEVIQSITRELVQEIHRVVEQMALAVDNNAAAAVGRSGDSKDADSRATQIVLPAFGVHVREFAETVLDVVALARGESLTWSVEGMDRYEGVDASTIVDTALASDPLGIPSVTHRRELFKAVSRAMLPHVREDVRAAIDREIEAGVNAEDVLRESTVPPPGGKNGPDSSVPPDGGDGNDPSIPPPPRVPREMQ